MQTIIDNRIQIISIIASLSFFYYISRLIIKGKLREEYMIIWIINTVVLLMFSFWREGIELVAKFLGVYSAPNLIFTVAIFAVLIYLLHLSVVYTKVQNQNKILAQELALLKQSVEISGKEKRKV